MLGLADEVVQGQITGNKLIWIKGTKVRPSASVILRGTCDLKSVEDQLRYAIFIVKRVLEVGKEPSEEDLQNEAFVNLI